MKTFETLLVEIKDQVATVTLNRPDVHNAFNETLIAELSEAMDLLSQEAAVRAIVITGAGASFCAGGDLNWMKKCAAYSREENIQDAAKLHEMLTKVSRSPKPVIAKVNGTAMGGGVGLVSAVDFAFAHKSAMFALSEVRLGLLPAVISPFVLRKMGEAKFREYSLTAERFSAMQAKELGLLQQCGDPTQIDELIDVKIQAFKAAGPQALAETKKLVEEVSGLSLEEAGKVTAKYLADRRASPEAKEGIDAFFNKRKPSWIS
ncbi:MAG: enoyl-CoA hydratase/isomerase family protein [bacterium]